MCILLASHVFKRSVGSKTIIVAEEMYVSLATMIIILLSGDFSSEGVETDVYVLVASVDLVNVADYACAFG